MPPFWTIWLQFVPAPLVVLAPNSQRHVELADSVTLAPTVNVPRPAEEADGRCGWLAAMVRRTAREACRRRWPSQSQRQGAMDRSADRCGRARDSPNAR